MVGATAMPIGSSALMNRRIVTLR